MSTITYSVYQSRLCIVLGWIHTVLLAFGFYPLIASCGGLTGADYTSFCAIGLLLFIPAILGWWLLRKIHNMFLYLFAGTICSSVLGILAFGAGKKFEYSEYYISITTFALSIAIFIIHSISRVIHGEMKADFIAAHGADVPFQLKVWEVPTILTHPNTACIGWFVVQYIIGLVLRQPGYWRCVFYLTLLDVIVLFAFRYLNQFQVFLQENQNSASLPVRTIHRVHLILFVLGILLFMILLIPSVLYNREPLSEISFERKPIITENEGLGGKETSVEDFDYDMMIPEIIMNSESSEAPVWISYLIDIMLGILTIAFFICLILGVIRAVRYAVRNFSIKDEDEVIFLEDIEEENSTKKEPKTERFFSTNMHIRRRYKKIIRKATKGTPDFWATPSELEEHAGLSGTDRMNILHEVYEKARYSKDGANREDAERVQR